MKFSQALVAIALTSTAVAAQDTTTSELVAELIETEQELVKEETVLEGMIRNITQLSNQTEIVPLVAELEEELQPGVTEPTVTLTAAPEDMVVMDAHVDTPDPEPVEETLKVGNSLIDGTYIAHEESAHQHKKSERMRAKAGKGHKIDDEDELLHEVVDESDIDEPSMTTETVDMNAKTHKEAVGPNSKSYKAAEPSMSYVVTTSKASKHSKATATHSSKSSKSGHGSLSLEMEEVMPDSDDMSMPTSPGDSKAHKSSKAKSAKRGKVQDNSMSMVTSMDEIGGGGQVLRGGKSHKGTVETATDATDYVEYTEAPDLEEEEETTPLIGSLPEPGQEDNVNLPEGEGGGETQPVVRTPDMKPKSGTSTSDLNKKYQQEVKDGMLHDNGSNSNPTHNQKENVGTLDLNAGESKLQNGAQMADVASGASSISSSSVILGGICLMVSAVYAMAV